MAEVAIPFDGNPYTIQVPDDNLAEVLRPTVSQPAADLDVQIERALDNPIGQAPLKEWIKPTDRILIVSDDNTRLTPTDRIIPHLLGRLNSAGVPNSQICCIMALGTHRYMTEQEIINKVGKEICRKIRVINHDWRNPQVLVDLCVSKKGIPIVVNREAVEADVLIGLGAVVPHHICGYSGSSKIIQPGICGARTTAETHLLSCSQGGDSFLGLEDNPIRREMNDIAERVNLKAICNVVLNSKGETAAVFFGEMRSTFRKAARKAQAIYGVNYHEEPDVVLVNSHPCDIDFWQSHKSMYPAQRMIKPGGTIIVCTPAPEGVSPVHTELLNFASWPSRKIEKAYRQGKLKNGVAAALGMAWAKVREKASIITYSPGIPPEDKACLGHTHAPSIEWALEEALRRQGPKARITVLTHAPDMLPIKDF